MGMFMTADRRNEQARPPRTASCGSGGRALWEGWERRSVLNNCLRLIVDDLAGSELGFELLNDLRMHLLIDLDLEPEHDEAEDDENKRDVEGEGLERGDVGRGHVGCRSMTGHASREGNGTDRTVGHRAADLVEHGTHRQGDRLVALAVLQLAVLDGVGQRQNRGHLDELRRHIEEDQGDDDDRQVAGEQGKHRVADDHGDHAAGEQVATGNPAVENRVQRRHDESGDQRDDAGDGEGGRLVKHEHEEVVHHTGRDDVCDGVQQVGQGDPQQLVVLEQRLERLERVAVLLGLGTQRAGAFLGAKGDGPGGNQAEERDDEAEGGPSGLALALGAGERPGEVS